MSDASKPPDKTEPLDLGYLEAIEHTLSEWDSENDDHSYRDL